MATKKSSAGGFKQMPKMDTTEPSVILKMAKGGHVNTKQLAKAENGFAPMSSNPKYRESMEAESGNAPKKPSMSARRQAMNPNFNKGGKVVKKSLGGIIAKMVAGKNAVPASAPTPPTPMNGGLSGLIKEIPRAIQSATKNPAPAMPPAVMKGLQGVAPKVAQGMKSIFRKDGGSADMAQDKAMIKKAMKQHDAQEHAGGKGTKLSLKTGGVTKGNGGGYKTGGVALGQGGYAKGGIINTEGQGGEYRNTKVHEAKVDRAPAKTGDVKLGNGGGYKVGGKASKKAYATGGNVNDEGKAVKMPKHFVSRPVANSLQSGTFKKGGKVDRKSQGGLEDMSKGAYDKAVSEKPVGSGFASKVQGAIDKFFNYKKPAGTVTETKETVTTSKKRGGKVC